MHRLFLSLLFISSFIYPTPVTSYPAYAQQWASHYIYRPDGSMRISMHERDAIRELIILSKQRSEATLHAQEAALQMVISFWHIWQNIAQTRLNPSHNRPYDEQVTADEMQAFFSLINQQEAIAADYAHAAQDIVHGDVLKSRWAKEAVTDMRKQARAYMLDALSDIKKQLGDMYAIAFKHLPIEDTLEDDTVHRGLQFAEFITTYIPQLAVHTFVHADRTHNRLSEEGWHVLEKIQRIGNQVWHAIETARSAFYQALLDQLD